MASADAPQMNYQYGTGGLMTGSNMNYEGMNIGMNAPGSVDPMAANPYAGQYLSNVNNLYSQFENSAAGGAFNPNFYNQLKQTQEDQITTSLGNQYARMGLSGSSAEMGGMNAAIQQNQMSWLNRQQSDQMRALGGLEGLNKSGYGMTTGIQNQYGGFENLVNQSMLNAYGASQGQANTENQMLAGLLGAGGQAYGQYAGMSSYGAAMSPYVLA